MHGDRSVISSTRGIDRIDFAALGFVVNLMRLIGSTRLDGYARELVAPARTTSTTIL